MENKTIVQAIPARDEFLSSALAVEAIVGQQKLIKDVLAKVMVKDQHYGTIPGCPKPSLWKPGAELICMTFRLAPDFTSEVLMDGKHMTVRSVCRLTHIPTSKVFGSAEAICSTKEKKYRQRKDGGKIVENGNLEDCYNTIIKMANKRSLVAAVLMVTAASDILTQDMGEEVYVDNEEDNAPAPKEVTPAQVVQKAEEKHGEAKANGYQPDAAAPGPVAEEAKQTQAPAITKEKRKWSGLIVKAETLELPDKRMAWALEGADGVVFKTDDPKLVEGGIESGKVYDVVYHLNTRGTCVLTKLKEAKA